MDHVHLTCDPLEINKINDLVADDGCGAVSFFVGTTRDNFEAKKVLSLEYEAYEPMALKEMHGICKELRNRWPDIVNIAIYHRMGLVKVREASVIIAISSPHRQTALDATAQAIEELKRRVPIWKREKYVNDESAWKENKESKKSKQTLDFAACPIANVKNVMTDLVQIAAPETEVAKRIENFVLKKREEIDLSNKLDFVQPSAANVMDKVADGETSCARTNAVLIKQEPTAKGHLRVRHAARNDFGPQTQRPDYLETIDKHMSGRKFKAQNHLEQPKHTLFDERIENIETFLRLPTSTSQKLTISQRLKAVEDRLLLLEATSPEYKHFWQVLSTSHHEVTKRLKKETKPLAKQQNRRAYSIAQLDAIINEYESGD